MTAGARPPGAGGAFAAGAARSAGSRGTAIEVPGLGALNKGGLAGVVSVSCGSAGNCAAGGYYIGRHGRQQGFVAVEKNGVWGTAVEVPGLGALSKGGGAGVVSVSCGSAGNCAAGGYYTGRHDVRQGFVAVERHGRWGRALAMPRLGPVISVSCPSAGNCAAAGPASVATLRRGRWGRVIEVPGLGALAKESFAVTGVSCGAAGSCVVGGDYTDRRGIGQGFVAVERHGRWGKAIEVPGLGALNKGGDVANGQSAEVWSVSCASAGNCAAGGGTGTAAATPMGSWSACGMAAGARRSGCPA